jgi:hypothetical protein
LSLALLRGGVRKRTMATRPKSILAVASVVILLATSVGGGAARAQDEAQKQIDASIKQAIGLRKEGKDRQALDELQRAARLGHSPRLSAQTGFAEQALGLWVPAEKDLRDALAESSDPWIRKNRRTLEESLANVGGHLASVDIWGPPDGAQILIDGEPAGALPLSAPIRVPADTVEVTIRADGFVPAKRKLELSPGANVREHVVLHAIDVTPQPPPTPAAAPVVHLAPTDSPAESPAEQHPSIFTRWWFWTIVAVVVAGGATAAVLATRKDSSCTVGTCTNF